MHQHIIMVVIYGTHKPYNIFGIGIGVKYLVIIGINYP